LVAEGVEVAVPAPYVDDAVGDGGRAEHDVVGRVAPQLRSGDGLEGVDGVAIIVPKVDDAVGDGVSGRVVPEFVARGAVNGLGYAISELSESDLFAIMLKWTQIIAFEVFPVLSAEQSMKAIKQVAAAMQGQ